MGELKQVNLLGDEKIFRENDEKMEYREIFLDDNRSFYVKAKMINFTEEVSFKEYYFDHVVSIIEGIGDKITTSLKKIQPDKASVTFGFEFGVTTKGITALLVEGSGKASLEITLEWTKKQ